MFYVYIIQSQFDKTYYKGFSIHPILRLQQHNNKETKYTSHKIPWVLVYIEILETKTLALKREKALKKYSHQQIEQLIEKRKGHFVPDGRIKKDTMIHWKCSP